MNIQLPVEITETEQEAIEYFQKTNPKMQIVLRPVIKGVEKTSLTKLFFNSVESDNYTG